MSDMAITAKWSDFSNLDGESLLAMANERLPRWVTLALVIAIAWQLSQIVWMLVPSSPVDAPIIAPPMPANAGTTASTGNQPSVIIIAEAHLFGEASVEDAAPVISGTNVDTLPDARVSLSLKGTVAATDPNSSFAIIADSNKEEKVYKIGDPVLPGTKIHEIHLDLIVLNQNGALSKLRLPKDFPQGTTVRRATPTVNRAASNNTKSIQNVVAQNVSKLADVIRPTPYFEGGQQLGYRVYPGRDRKQFAALGLRPGDLIKDIDGAALTDPKQAMEIFQNLGNAEQVSVTVERNGQPQTLVLKTSQLALEKNK